MRKLLPLIIALFSYTVIISQEFGPQINASYCSHSKMYKNLILKSDEINQSPLLFKYDVKFYHLNLEVENNTTYLAGSARIYSQVISEVLDTFVVELLDEMIIDSIKINGLIEDYFREESEVFIPLSESLSQLMFIDAFIYYHGTPAVGGFFSGVNMEYDSIWNKSAVWTLSEPFNARQWWPTKQVLQDKADSSWVFLTTSNNNLAGSNGVLENVVNLPDNKVRYEWKSRYPIAYYLISYAVAEYQEYNLYAKPQEMGGDSLLIQNYIYDSPGCLENYKEGIDLSVELIELFSDLYSIYPFFKEKYGHCLTGLSGGMEHQTMTTLGGFGLGLVAHEMAHMWFGDNVTCATWSDIWINEGFATYSDYLAHEKIAGEYWSKHWMNLVHPYVMSQPDGSVYVPPDEIAYDNILRIFDSRLTYYKGALILHMIRYELDDDDLFFQVFQNFQNEFKDSVATADDFVHSLNQTTGKNFDLFFDQWFYGQGYPICAIDYAYSTNANTLEITSTQTTSASNITPFFEMNFPIKIYFNDGTNTTIKFEQKQPIEMKAVNINAGVDSIQVDPENWVLLQVESINGLNRHDVSQGIFISPIPANDVIVVSVPPDFISSSAWIHDIYGKRKMSFIIENEINRINLQSLNPGIYFLMVESDKDKNMYKFIKQ